MTQRSVARGLAWAALGAVAMLMVMLALRRHSAVNSVSGVAWVAAVGVLVTSTFALIVGLPFHLLFRRYGVGGLIPYLCVGAIAGLLFSLVETISLLATGGTAFDWTSSIAHAALVALPCGVVGSALFWTLVVRQPPR